MSNEDSIKIKFDYEGVNPVTVELMKSDFIALFPIGALRHTARLAESDQLNRHLIYPTDREGLEEIANMTGSTLLTLHRSLAALGKMIAVTDPGELGDDFQAFGWLINGLSELANIVEAEHSQMRQSLNRLEENRS